MNLLFIYHRDIHQDDSGASRTIILREHYLAKQEGVKVYAAFHHLSFVDKCITEVPLAKLDSENLRKCIYEKSIDVLCVPEGEMLITLAYAAIKDTNCKIVAEFHNKPNYKVDNLLDEIKRSLFLSPILKVKLKAFLKFILYPLYRQYIGIPYIRNSQRAYLLADRLVLLSHSYINQYQNAFHLSDIKKMTAIGNPLSFESKANHNDIAKKEKVVLVVARLYEASKRISLAIKVWGILESRNPDWKMQIVGEGSDENTYRKMVDDLKLQRVSFEGWKYPEEYYLKSSIFLMTSAFEGWPMTVLEAQQKGCVPIVMDSFSAIHDIIQNSNNGILVKNRDITSMASVVQELIYNQTKREQIALNAIKSSDRFNMDIIGSKWLELYRSLL